MTRQNVRLEIMVGRERRYGLHARHEVLIDIDDEHRAVGDVGR